MFSIVLVEPEIPPNTGNIIRLCANCGAELHLVEPLGFSLDEKSVRRAGLDYRDLATVSVWQNWAAFAAQNRGRLLCFSTRAKRYYTQVNFAPGDVLVFGAETRGLADEVLLSVPPAQRLRIPMAGHSRSLNLSNSVAIATYEAWRQNHFALNGQTSEPPR